MLGIGDSFTSGIGSNGLPDYMTPSYDCARYKKAWPVQLSNMRDWSDFNVNQPRLTFGACAGAKTFDVIGKQLRQGDPQNVELTPIGKPQIGVMTVGGNNVEFSKYVTNGLQGCALLSQRTVSSIPAFYTYYHFRSHATRC